MVSIALRDQLIKSIIFQFGGSAERVSQYETREQSREDKGEDGERKNATASVECKREEFGFDQFVLLCLT